MDKKQEYSLKEAIRQLFDLASELSFDTEDQESFQKWVRTELLGEQDG